MDEVQRIRNRVEHDSRTAEHTGALTYRSGEAFPVAVHFEGLPALSVDLTTAFLEDYCLGGAHWISLSVVAGLKRSNPSIPQSLNSSIP
jgi:hypothetical protein